MRFRLLTALLLSSSAVVAQHAHDPAAAEALFTAAREDMANGEVREACRKFDESQRLDPAVGTLINLAACLEKLGQLSAAWEKWQQAQRQLSPTDERMEAVKLRAKSLDQRLPRLTISLAPNSPLNATVLRDGVDLRPAALTVPLPVDPGLHVLIVRAPGHKDRRYEIDLREGEKRKLTLAVAAETTVPASAKTTERALPPEPVKTERVGQHREPPVLGYVLLGSGAAAAVVGAIAGLSALDKKREMEDDCSTQNGRRVCGPSGLDAADSGKTYATVSNVAFVVAAVGLGAGTYFTFFATNGSDAQSAQLNLRRSF